MEWFVVVILAFFIFALLWVSGEAIRHVYKSKTPNKASAADARSSRGCLAALATYASIQEGDI